MHFWLLDISFLFINLGLAFNVVFFFVFFRWACLCRNEQFELNIRPLAVTSLAFLYVGEVFSGSRQQTSWWKRQWAGGSSCLKHSKLQTLPKIPRLCFKKCLFFLRLENYIFLYFIIQVPIFCLPLSHQKLLFLFLACWAHKTKYPSTMHIFFSFVFFL